MPKRKYGGVLGPNTVGGSNPQFGNIETLPNGLNRQTSIIELYSINGSADNWTRLTFNFPECLGIKQTLDNAAKTTSCIPSLDMDVQIKIPIIKEVFVDILYHTSQKRMTAVKQATDRLVVDDVAFDQSFILTGEDQLVKTVPDMYDETKTDDLYALNFTDMQKASASEVIWAKISRPKDTTELSQEMQEALNAADKPGWLFGKTEGGNQGLGYDEVAATALNGFLGAVIPNEVAYINNIPKSGFKLLNDHVNMFVSLPWTQVTGKEGFEARVIIDYETSSVPLSSLLVWRQQLTEFVPKQIQWRGGVQEPGASKKNGFKFLISRGTVKETGAGKDPTNTTQFPNIAD